MNKIKKILAPTDFSELSKAGVRYALDLAKSIGAEVTVYHAVDYNEIMEYAEGIKEGPINYTFHAPDRLIETHKRALTRFLREDFSDLLPLVEVREKVELGRADTNIVEEAKTGGADLIVISTHGRTGLSHMLMGSVTEKVVRHAPCPVLSIHPRFKEEADKKLVAVA